MQPAPWELVNSSFPVQEHRTDKEPPQPAVASDGRLFIDLAGTVVEIESACEAWLSNARARYGSFVCREAPADLRISHTDDEASMTARHGCLSFVHTDGRSAEVAAAQGTEVLDGILRSLLPPVIAPDLMVHGALLSDGERGLMCCGVSGSGKSTIAALFPEAALCDEMVRLAGGRTTEARSLPFWRARPGTVPLGAIFVLEHGAGHCRTQVDVSEAMKEMRRHVYWPVEHSALMVESFKTLTDVCRGTPVFRLAFRPEQSVWKTMTAGF